MNAEDGGDDDDDDACDRPHGRGHARGGEYGHGSVRDDRNRGHDSGHVHANV